MILDMIQEWFKELLIDGIISNLTGMFDTLNTKVGEIAGEVGMTPAAWNSSIFNMIRNLSETVIARHKLLDALAFGSRVVLAVTFQKVDAAPHAQAAAQGDDQSLQNVDSVSKKAHIHSSFRSVELSG